MLRFRPHLAVGATLVALLAARPAFADPLGEALKNRFGTNKGNAQNLRELYERDVHAEITAGLWYANLSRGVSGLVDAQDDLGGQASFVTKANRSIGTGRGLVREIKFSVNVKGNEAFFDYLSDELLESGGEEAAKRVQNPVAKQIIRQLVGELRPDLRSVFGEKSKVWVKGEYGKFQGAIDNADVFASRNGQPYFASRSEGWKTDYFGLEAGIFPETSPPKNRDEPSLLLGFYGRYRRFTRPLVLGFDADGDRPAFLLQDGAVTAIDLGIRVLLARCGTTFCFEGEGSMGPFTGFSNIDLGRFGAVRGALFTLGGAARFSLPLRLSQDVSIGPYVGLRVDSMLPLTLASNDPIAPTFWAVDYFFIGPTFGLTGRL